MITNEDILKYMHYSNELRSIEGNLDDYLKSRARGTGVEQNEGFMKIQSEMLERWENRIKKYIAEMDNLIEKLNADT